MDFLKITQSYFHTIDLYHGICLARFKPAAFHTSTKANELVKAGLQYGAEDASDAREDANENGGKDAE